jgi:hypothetical protein
VETIGGSGLRSYGLDALMIKQFSFRVSRHTLVGLVLMLSLISVGRSSSANGSDRSGLLSKTIAENGRLLASVPILSIDFVRQSNLTLAKFRREFMSGNLVKEPPTLALSLMSDPCLRTLTRVYVATGAHSLIALKKGRKVTIASSGIATNYVSKDLVAKILRSFNTDYKEWIKGAEDSLEVSPTATFTKLTVTATRDDSAIYITMRLEGNEISYGHEETLWY